MGKRCASHCMVYADKEPVNLATTGTKWNRNFPLYRSCLQERMGWIKNGSYLFFENIKTDMGLKRSGPAGMQAVLT